ncbi:hypothetical protein Zmor_004000 [Zophobas morio]|jgi:hypothetical protein|uniref:Uncharacterized protein n=1 Tax=Zophobas morio TaxID=2755281 RepID=A0AA38HK59_9CUCU|nr:hypothetical protein Zmor_004000 [Zophobas morio]
MLVDHEQIRIKYGNNETKIELPKDAHLHFSYPRGLAVHIKEYFLKAVFSESPAELTLCKFIVFNADACLKGSRMDWEAVTTPGAYRELLVRLLDSMFRHALHRPAHRRDIHLNGALDPHKTWTGGRLKRKSPEISAVTSLLERGLQKCARNGVYKRAKSLQRGFHWEGFYLEKRKPLAFLGRRL